MNLFLNIQAELGDIGEDLGISGSTDQPIVAEAHQEVGVAEDEVFMICNTVM